MDYLKATYFFDYKSEEIQNMISKYKRTALSDVEKTRQLYLVVRDNWRYDPYNLSLSKEKYKASRIAKNTKGHCVDKSILLISGLRALGIPARLHLGKVKNHIAVERLEEKFGTNELTPHGMVNVQLNNKWIKLSPAFNKSLCEIYKVEPLDFDGEHDSYLQKYNSEGNLFMEYLEDYGYFEDVPVEFMIQNVLEHYPHIFDSKDGTTEFKL